jgi:cytochrome c oxidase cbb3-type subunit 3
MTMSGVEPEETAERERADGARHDGIGEEDNPVPRWWWITFFATLAWAFLYAPYYLFSGWSQEVQYDSEVAAAAVLTEALKADMPTSNPFRGNAVAVGEGGETWATICSVCHKPDGSGLVGPSVVDPYWKYGNDDVALFETVAKGRPAGMPPWEAQLGSEKIWKVLAYMETLPKTDQPGMGAPAEGTGG